MFSYLESSDLRRLASKGAREVLEWYQEELERWDRGVSDFPNIYELRRMLGMSIESVNQRNLSDTQKEDLIRKIEEEVMASTRKILREKEQDSLQKLGWPD